MYETYLKRKLDRSMDQEYWPKQNLEKNMWFPFQGILEHAAYHTKRTNNIQH